MKILRWLSLCGPRQGGLNRFIVAIQRWNGRSAMPRFLRIPRFGVCLAGCLIPTLVGCAGADLSSGSIAPYEPANSFYPYGYEDTVVAENQHRISASGSARAAKTRLEKIALTRAAEVGVEGKKRYFKVSNLSHSVACGKKITANTTKGLDSPAANRAVVTVDVVYADTPIDPEFRDTATSLAEYKAALEADTAGADSSQADELKAQCGA